MKKLIITAVALGAWSTTCFAQEMRSGQQQTSTRTQGTGTSTAPANVTDGSKTAQQPGTLVRDTAVNTESSNITAESNTAGSNTGATEAVAVTQPAGTTNAAATGTVSGTTTQGGTVATTTEGGAAVPTSTGTAQTVEGSVATGTSTNAAVNSVTQSPAAAGTTVRTQTTNVTQPAAGTNVTVTSPGRGTGVATVTSPSTITYEQRAEAAYRAAGVPQDMIVKLRDYDVKIRDARLANDAELVRRYYSEQAGLLTPQQINGVTTYLRSNPIEKVEAVTVWEDPAYVAVASPSTVINPTTVVTREVRTDPIVTRQVQVPVTQGSVPVVVRDPVPVVRTEISAPATIQVEVTPAPVVTTTEEYTTYTRISSDRKTKEK